MRHLLGSHPLSAVLTCFSMLLALPAKAQSGEPVEHAVLMHAFMMPANDEWGSVSVKLSAGTWRVGRANGPLATAADLSSALQAISQIELGAVCSGSFDGPTVYPCGYAFREIDLTGTVGDNSAVIAFDKQGPDPKLVRVAADAGPTSAAGGATISPVLDSPRFVALRLPIGYLGDKSAAFGGQLQFEIRAVSNPLVPSVFDRASGMIILRSRAKVATPALRSSNTVPQRTSVPSPAAFGHTSPIEAYYYFVHWVSMGRMDRALQQFAATAWVVAGSGCPAASPCVGTKAIRDRYLPALMAGEVPLPLVDLRFDGATVRTYGDTFTHARSTRGVVTRTGNHQIELSEGKILGLWFDQHTFEKDSL